MNTVGKDQTSHLVYLNIIMHKITNLWKLNWLRDNNRRKTPVSHEVVCFQMLDFGTSKSNSEVSKLNSNILWIIFRENYVTIEGAVSYDVLYYQQLSVACFNLKRGQISYRPNVNVRTWTGHRQHRRRLKRILVAQIGNSFFSRIMSQKFTTLGTSRVVDFFMNVDDNINVRWPFMATYRFALESRHLTSCLRFELCLVCAHKAKFEYLWAVSPFSTDRDTISLVKASQYF